jgi:hypothetical protein
MKTKICLCISLSLSLIATRAEELTIETVPTAVADRVAQLVSIGDYAGVTKASEDIDNQFKGVHDAEYFRNLLGIVGGLLRDKGELSYNRRWAIRKLQWKILLTKYSSAKDAETVLKMKDWLSSTGFASYGASRVADDTQFVALRLDAASLLWSYGEFLRQSIIPNYQRKPEGNNESGVILDPVAAAQAVAQAKQLAPILTQNKCDNLEQESLTTSLRLLNRDTANLVLHDFSWPPEDDATITKLLETFPADAKTRERLLDELAARRQAFLGEYRECKEKAVAAMQHAK